MFCVFSLAVVGYSCYFIIFAATVISQLFCVTLTYRGSGARPVLYNFRGSEVQLYNIIWKRGVVKKINIFVL